MPRRTSTSKQPRWWVTVLVVLILFPWLWIGGVFLGSYVDLFFIPFAWRVTARTALLVLPTAVLAHATLMLICTWPRILRWIGAVVFALVGIAGLGAAVLFLALGAAVSGMGDPRPVTEPAQCMAGGGGNMIVGVVNEWTACVGADESFLQGHLLYLDGEGVADPSVCEAFKAATPKPKPESVWCDASAPEFWTKVECPAFAGPKADVCFECSTRTASVDDYAVLLGWTEDCSEVHVVRSVNLALDDVAGRAAVFAP